MMFKIKKKNNSFCIEHVDLKYTYDSLEPYIDTKTMEVHHSKHLFNYVQSVNNILSSSTFKNVTILQKCTNLLEIIDVLPRFKKDYCDVESIHQKSYKLVYRNLKNSVGGVINHTIYFDRLSGIKDDIEIPKSFKDIIIEWYNSIFWFKQLLEFACNTRIGSGWLWFMIQQDQKNLNDYKFFFYFTVNQDCAIASNWYPLLAIDIWEHAYYLKHQNNKSQYLKDLWNIINWWKVYKYFQQFMNQWHSNYLKYNYFSIDEKDENNA